MVTKSKPASAKKNGRVKIGKLRKETVRELSAHQKKRIKGALPPVTLACRER